MPGTQLRIPRLCLLALAACAGNDRAPADASGPPADAVQIACPSSGPVSYQANITPLIGHCSTGDGCHGVVVGRLLTWPYQALVNVVAADCPDKRVIVKPGDPSSSYLIEKLLGAGMCSGARMPLRGTPLSDADMATIEAWICQGAPNN
jgi:hypothetical protein